MPVFLLAGGLALFTAARPARGIIVFSAIFPCAGILARLSGGADPYPWPGLVLAGLLVGWTFRFIYDFESSPNPSRADGPLRALLAVWTLASILAAVRARTLWALIHGLSGRAVNGAGLSDAAALRESLFSFAALAGGAVFYFLLRQSGAIVRERATRAAIIGVAVSAAWALLQRIGILSSTPDPFWRVTGRASGGALDPNSLGLLCALALPVALAAALRRGRNRALFAALAAVLSAGVVFSGSRSGAAVALIALTLFGMARAATARSRFVAFGAVLLAAAAAGVLANRGGSGSAGARLVQTFDPELPVEYRVSERPLLWRASVRLAAANPIEGGGMGTFAWRLPDLLKQEGRSLPTRDNPGSGYVQALAETGVIGLLLTLFAVASIGRQAWRTLRSPGEPGGTRATAGAAAGAVIAFLVALIAGSHWLAPDVSLLFFLLAARSAEPGPAEFSPWRTRGRVGLVLAYGAAAALAIAATAAPSETFRYGPRAGFHEREMGPGGPFRWTSGKFALWLRPGETVRLGLANFGPEGKLVRVAARVGGRDLYRTTLEPGQVRALWLVGAGRPSALLFVLDRSFVPRRLGLSADRRTLGLLSTASNDLSGP